MLNKFILILIISVLQITLVAQVSQQWVQRFNGPASSSDHGAAIATDAAGDVYVTGFSTGSGSGHDYQTIKYNSTGVQQWAAIYNGPGNGLDDALDIAVDAAGNVYITGKSAAGADEYTYDYATIKYNSGGVQQWVARYNGPNSGQDVGFAITVDAAGNVYVTGQSGHPALDSEIGILKYNSGGVLQWAVNYDATGNWDTGNDIITDELGNVYVAGFHSTNWGTAYLDFVTLKYNSSGVQQWLAGYNGTGNNSDEAVAIGLDGSGNVYVTGFATGTVYDMATIKYNNSGAQQWIRVYSSSSPSIDVPNDMSVDAAGNVYITGAISFDFGTLKYNTDGVQQWITRYDFNGNFDAATSLALDGSGNVYITGYSGAAQTESSNDYATLKYNSSGVQQWVQRYNAGDRDDGFSIAVDAAGNVYVTGESAGTGPDFATVKYSQTVGIEPVSNEIPDRYSLMQNYPNPFNPSTKIKFQLVKSGFVKLSIYDMLGQEIQNLVNQELIAGIYEINWDGSGFSSGVYMYRINAGDFTDIKKMILVK